MIDTEKQAMRKELIQKRESLSSEVIAECSSGAMELIRAMAEWRNAKEVLVYWPIRGEMDMRPLVTELWQRGATVLMPRCRPDVLGEMDLACATCEDDLVPGPFSIMEPNAETCPVVNDCKPDLAIIPAVVFDRRGYRLGYGGGYYDRLLATGDLDNALKIGLGYGFQLVEEIPTDPWDMPVDVICTDEELWRP